jgi:glycosyltransferase involved in cell wall biosynthesis
MGIVAWGLANSLDETYEVHILTTEKGVATPKRRLFVHLVPFSPFIRYPFQTMAYGTILKPMMSKVIREISPDILHSHLVYPYGYIFRSEKRIKKIISMGGPDEYPLPTYPMRHLITSTLKNSDVVVSNSKWLSSFVQKNYNVRPVVLPTGVDTRIFRPSGDPNKNKVVLYVGRLVEAKGVLELVNAARALPEYEFWLVGDGPLKIPTLPNVKILGFHDNTVALYASASVCAFPSHYENFPLVGLEAMACGRAVVATELGFSEYIENGKDGILVKPHDVRELIGSIRYLMEDETARTRLEGNARRKAIQYDWNVVAKRYEALYESTLATSARRL